MADTKTEKKDDKKAEAPAGDNMTGREFIQKLREAMTDSDDPLLDNRLLAIGRQALAANPKASAFDILTAYREYGFTVEKALGKSPADVAAMMERHEFVANTLKKAEQIYLDGEHNPENLITAQQIPIEELDEHGRRLAGAPIVPVAPVAARALAPEYVGPRPEPEYDSPEEIEKSLKAAAPAKPDTVHTRDELEGMTVDDLRKLAHDEKVDLTGLTLKPDIVKAILKQRAAKPK